MIINKNKFLEVLNKANKQLEYQKREDDTGFYSFKLESINDNDPTHEVLSDIIYKAEVSRDYAYIMVVDGLNALVDIVDSFDPAELVNNLLIDTDELSESISGSADSLTPIYNSEIMDFVSENPYKVDDAIKEFGKADSLIRDGQVAYYMAQEQIIFDLVNQLSSLVENN